MAPLARAGFPDKSRRGKRGRLCDGRYAMSDKLETAFFVGGFAVLAICLILYILFGIVAVAGVIVVTVLGAIAILCL